MPDASFVVVVRNNLVVAIRPAAGLHTVAAVSNLEVSSRLAESFQVHGRIDGEYLLGSAAQARAFALLCLDFIRALSERRHALIEGIRGDPLFEADGERTA